MGGAMFPRTEEPTIRTQNTGPIIQENQILLATGMSVIDDLKADDERVKLESILMETRKQLQQLESALESAKVKALEVNKFFGEDQSLTHSGNVIEVLAEFIDFFE